MADIVIKKMGTVQALDELGRWCDAKIVGQGNDCEGDYFDVSFPGYPCDDLRVGADCVRQAFLPFNQQVREQLVSLPNKRNARGSPQYTREHMTFMRKCQRGDSVQTQQGTGTIYTVDPFKRKLILADGSCHDLLDIILDNQISGELSTRKRRKKRAPSASKRKTCQDSTPSLQDPTPSLQDPTPSFQDPAPSIQDSMPSLQDPTSSLRDPAPSIQDSTGPLLVEQEDKSLRTTHPTESTTIGNRVGNQSSQASYRKTFTIGSIRCGNVYKVKDLEISLMVKDLDLTTKRCEGWPVIQNGVQKDVTISLDARRLHTTPEKLSGEVKKIGKELLHENMAITVNNCQSVEYRMKLREVQIFAELCTYVEHTLAPSCRSFRKQFDLGLCNIDIDLQLFDLGVDSKSKEYSYKAGNMSKLDSCLGPQWDLLVCTTLTRFVTSLKIKLAANLHIQGTIKVAEYPGVVQIENYRNELKKHLEHGL